jgi:hypothetical protein
MAAEEVFLPFPGGSRLDLPLASRVKGAWLATSVRNMRVQGHYDRYVALLSAAHRETLLNVTVNGWYPLDPLLAHYDACDRLNLTANEIVEMSQRSTKHAQGGAIGVAARLATGAGVSPWTILAQFHKFWSRFFIGGGVAVFKLGPKEARVDVAQFPGCRYRHARIGMRGVVEGAVELFCTRAFTHDLPSMSSDTDASIRVAWA